MSHHVIYYDFQREVSCDFDTSYTNRLLLLMKCRKYDQTECLLMNNMSELQPNLSLGWIANIN